MRWLTAGSRGRLCLVLLCGWIAWSQHISSDGSLWWRAEHKGLSDGDCRALLKRVTGRPKVGFTKWYDVTPQQLTDHFGQPPSPDKGTWLACWPEGFDFDRDLVDK